MSFKIEINITKKRFISLIIPIFLLVFLIFVWAYDSNMNEGDPIKMGHSAGEIHVKNSSDNTVKLQEALDSLYNDLDSLKSKIDFYWAYNSTEDPSFGCAQGYVPTELVDNLNAHHDLGESSPPENARYLIVHCAKGVEISWGLNDCPSGYLDTGIRDDDDNKRALWEQQKNGPGVYKLCMKGIAFIEWTSNCRDGFVSTQIYDNIGGDTSKFEKHYLWENNERHGVIQLCVK